MMPASSRGLRRPHRYAQPAAGVAPQRVLWVCGILALLALALIGRALYLQVFQQDFLQEQGDSRFVRNMVVPANRGAITDRSGTPLAVSVPVETLFWLPLTAKERAEIEAKNHKLRARGKPVVPTEPTVDQLRQLAALLDMSTAELLDKGLDPQRRKGFVYIKRQISPELAAQVKALKIPGLGSQPEFRRFYPAAETTAHLLGFTNIDGRGQEGLELAKNRLLAGLDGKREVLRDRRGEIIDDISAAVPPRNGQPLTLAIDHRIQYLAFRELKAAVETNKAKAGSVVVLDGKTGEVLAMANWPSYNPNSRTEMDPEARRNRAVVDLFEPGSTMKPFAVAMAVNAGKVTPNTVMDTRPYKIGPAQVRDSHPAPVMSVTEVIQKSSNVGSSKMALMFSPEQMWQFYDQVGFGRAPRVGFPGESTGRLRAWQGWRPIEQATMSFGYGVSVSLLQLARAYTLFTNDGAILPASLYKLSGPQPSVPLVSPKTAREMREMMMTVTQEGGTAQRAQVLGFNVGGKTGTARKLVGGRYQADKHLALFAGFAPATRPRLIVTVMVDEPTGGSYYGGTVAGPAFANIMAGSLRLLGVEPDAPTQNTLLPPADEASARDDL